MVPAAAAIVDPNAIAHPEAILGTEPPDRGLDEAREWPWERGIECPGINGPSRFLDDAGAPIRPIAARVINVLGPELPRDPISKSDPVG